MLFDKVYLLPVFLNQQKPKPDGALLVFGKTKLKGKNIFRN